MLKKSIFSVFVRLWFYSTFK